jgi:DNA-binding transcriptional LysR family regulator
VRPVNLDAVAAFAVFAECLNFSTAAQRLSISQPALHVKVRKLAEQLDVALYRRAGRALTLTAHGERVARFGRELTAQAGALSRALRGAADERVTLAAGEGAYSYLLATGIRRFIRQGGARLALLTRDRDGALDAVRCGRAHVGVAPLETVPDDIVAHALTSVAQVLVVPAGHPLARRRRAALRDLAGAELVVPPEERPHRRLLAQALQAQEVPWHVAVEANGWELMIRFVQMGVGLAVVNACCRLPRGLVGVPLPELPALRYHLFQPKVAWSSPAVRQLVDALRAHAEDWKP